MSGAACAERLDEYCFVDTRGKSAVVAAAAAVHATDGRTLAGR